MRTPDSIAIPTAHQGPWFVQLDPFGDDSKYGMPWIWLYAYFYGQPPLDRPSDFLFNNLSRMDTAIYVCVAGFVDYSLACSLHFITWLLPLPFLEAIGSRNWFNTLLLLSFFVRARYSGLLEYLNDSKTSLRSAAGGIAETFPALCWHLFFKVLRRLRFPFNPSLFIQLFVSWRTNGEFTDISEFSRPLPVKLDNRTWTQTFADVAQSSFRDALYNTITGLLGPHILVIVVAVVAFILNGLYLLFNALWEPQLWAEITEWATDWLQDMQSIIERDLAKRRSLWKWTERQLHKITVPAMRLFSDFVMHALRPSRRNMGFVASTSFLELAWDLAKWAAPSRERRYLVVKRIDNYTTKTRLCYWPPVPALSAHNLRAAFNLAYGQTSYVCDILWRRHLPTQKRPYTDLYSNQIRLLKLFPAQLDSQRLECTLDAYNLGVDAPRYLAISYRWSDEWSGSNRKTKPVVIVNGFRLAIGASTYEALRAVRSRWRTKMVWIDAVCINQKDDVEKGHQVKMMADIYAQSQKVIIWLGEPENARLAIRSLWGLWVRAKLLADMDDRNLMMHIYEHRAVAPSWFALKDLVRREWFQRAWIAQEVAVASRAEIRYGTASLPWDVLASFVLTVSQTPGIKNLLSSDYNVFESARGNLRARADFAVPWDIVGSLGLVIVPQTLDLMKPAFFFSNTKAPKSTQGSFGMQNTRVLLMLRALNQSGRRGSVDFYMRNLYRGRGTFKCAEHRDRLYAVLSMSQERHLPEFEPDYGAPVTDIYTKAAAHCYRKGRHLLAESGRGYEYEWKHHACDFPANGSGCRCGNVGPLPSWVPNWAGLRFHNPLDIDAHESDHVGIVSTGCLVSLTSAVRRPNYYAIRASTFRALSVSRERLEIGGCQRIDVLEHCGARYGPAYVQRTAQDEPPNQPPNLRWNRFVYDENIPLHGPGCWWELASKHSPEYYPQIGTATGAARDPTSGCTTRLGAFWRTILANRLGTIDLPEREMEGLFVEFAQNMRLMQQGIESPATVLSNPGPRHRHMMFAGPLAVCMGRRFGVTRRGLMGLFPWGARDGDEVWLMSGVTTPLLFRRCRHNGDELLENIGECYVHGTMNGEAWDPLAAIETVVLV